MPNTFFGLTIGSSGLNAANIALNTTSHNISKTENQCDSGRRFKDVFFLRYAGQRCRGQQRQADQGFLL